MAKRVQSLTRNNKQTKPKIAKQKLYLYNFSFPTMRVIAMFIAVVCVLFLVKLRWPEKQSICDRAQSQFRRPYTAD